MPTYSYRCPTCGDFTEWASIKADSRTTACRCGLPAIKILTVPHVSASARPNGVDQATRDALARDIQQPRDMEAYKRIRREGLQPRSIDGCAELEARANTRTEIEMGRRLPRHAAWVGSEVASDIMGKEVGEMVRGGTRS